MEKEMLRKIGKVELHCHLDGSLSYACIRRLAALAGQDLPKDDEGLARLVSVPDRVDSLMTYLQVFDVVLPLLQTEEALRLAAYDLVEQAAAENVLYIEVRFAPFLSTKQGLSVLQVVQAVLEGLRQAEQELGVVARAIVCGLKQADPDQTLAVFHESLSLVSKGLVAFDFAGNEADFPTEVLRDVVAETQKLGLPLTFHAGECGCVANVAQALQLGIKRIGHGTALTQDPAVIQQVVEQGATIEICLTSNLHTQAAASLADFPYLALKEAGARLTINTDNRTVSSTNLTKEYSLFVEHFGTSLADFHAYNTYAIEASFATAQEKEQLQHRLDASYASVKNSLT